jgi:O-glycosyl hydrolase
VKNVPSFPWTTILFFLLQLLWGAEGFSADTAKIRIDPKVVFQTMDGFGASDAWQCAIVGETWPVEKREHIADLLFSRQLDEQGSPRGIGLSVWRFNVGAGTAQQGDASGIKNPWRRAECFQEADGRYDWSRQAGQRWFLQAAQARGVDAFLAFSNSPPVHLTRNGKGYATKDSPYLNLKPGKLADFGKFLAEVVEHFEKAGLHFDYLSPINEPQWAWDEADQEGTPASNIEIHELVCLLSKELRARRLSTRIVIGEAGTIGHVLKKMDNDGRDDQARFFFDPASSFYIGRLPNVWLVISAHDYHSVWPLEKQVEYRSMLQYALKAANPGLGYWMSEYCILEEPNDEIGGGGGRDLGMNLALYVARIIHHDLTVAQARSWQWWTAVSQVDFKDGLVYLDDGSKGNSGRMGPETTSLLHDGVVRDSKLLWALGNYARFVPPGAVRVQCQVEPEQSVANGLLASAYRGVDGALVTVIVNLSHHDIACDLGIARDVSVYTTSSGSNLQRSSQKGPILKVPARALCTCIVQFP